jgi:hypothetical protein
VNIFENVPVGDRGINYTADIGIADLADPDGAFVGALYSDIGPKFLKWTTFNPDPALTDPALVTPNAADPALSNYYVGNPAIGHRVVGSPFGTNLFRVERQVGADWVLVGQTNLFSVSGKIYDPATFQFTVNPAAPVAEPDAAALALAQASSVAINVLANDTFSAPATVAVTTQPAEGAAVASLNGTITYTPSAAFALTGGIDTFSYNIVDTTTLTSNNAIVTVTVTPVPVVEAITITRALLRANLRLDVRGTSNVEGSILTVSVRDANGNSTELGTAVVRNGRWSYRGTATANVTNVTVRNLETGATITQPLTVR